MRELLTSLLAAGLLGGCGCTETDLRGDTNTDVYYDGPWDPPIENLGEPGWRESTEPWCRGDSARYVPLDVWSDERAVFIMVSDIEHPGLESLLANHGTGWEPLAEVGSDPGFPELRIDRITGVVNGPLFGWMNGSELAVIDAESGEVTTERAYVSDVFVVSEALAYAALSGDPRLVRYDGTSWGPFPGDPLPYDVHRVWADETSIFCAGSTGTIMSYEEGGWIVHDTGTLESIVSLWGFSGTDVWAGTDSGNLLHWNGTDWTDVDWPDLLDGYDGCPGPGQAIDGMWGTDGVLFFHTSVELVMFDGSGFSVLGFWPGTEVVEDGSTFCDGWLIIRGIWGNSATELFLVVEGSEIRSSLCEEYILWWDGHDFHWF